MNSTMLYLVVVCIVVVPVFSQTSPNPSTMERRIDRQLRCTENKGQKSLTQSAFCYNHWPVNGSFSKDVVDLTVHAADMKLINSAMIKDLRLNTSAMTALRLIKCRIEQIDSDTFNALVSLKEIELAENRLKTIPPNLFAKNKLLNRIVLRGNQLTTIDSKTFSALNSLSVLDISDNRLVLLPKDIPRSLKTLNLSKNKIRPIETIDLPNLERLNLCNNEIYVFAEDSIRGSKLEYLCLGDVTLLPQSTGFNNLKNLRELTLVGDFKEDQSQQSQQTNGNEAVLEDRILKSIMNCSQLEILTIQKYHLPSIAFVTKFTKLEKLSLHGVNVDESPSSNIFSELSKLNSFSLTKSKSLAETMLCNRAVKNLLPHLRYLNLEDSGLTDLKCLAESLGLTETSEKSPLTLDISKNPFNCDHPVTKQIMCNLAHQIQNHDEFNLNDQQSDTLQYSLSKSQAITLKNTDQTVCYFENVSKPVTKLNDSECETKTSTVSVYPESSMETTTVPSTDELHGSFSQEYIWFIVLGTVLLILLILASVLAYIRWHKRFEVTNNSVENAGMTTSQSFSQLKQGSSVDGLINN